MAFNKIPESILEKLMKESDTEYDKTLLSNYFASVRFYLLYFSVSLVILYTSIWDLESFVIEILKVKHNNIIIFVYNPNNYDLSEYTKVTLIPVENMLDPLFLLQELRHNYFYRLGQPFVSEEYIEEWVAIHNALSVESPIERAELFSSPIHETRNRPRDHYDLVRILYYISPQAHMEIKYFKKVKNLPYYRNNMRWLGSTLKNIVSDFDVEDYCSMYAFNKFNYIPYMTVNVIQVENVFYLNKCWYDKNKNPIRILDFEKDFEYKCWEIPEHEDIRGRTIEYPVDSEVMFLEYIYGFYNFGEFWDVLLRLILSPKKSLPLFHLRFNRVNDIARYLKEAGDFQYPTRYFYKKDTLYFFKKVNITLIPEGFYRGFLDSWMSMKINKAFNTHARDKPIYDIYLARGRYGRNIQQEDYIVNELKQRGFIVLDGSEDNELIKKYFTNAGLIIGAHGSLMKNIVWCKRNPFLIELCPTTRDPCFYDNATNCSFTPYIILTNYDEEERVILTDDQITNLLKLVDKLKG